MTTYRIVVSTGNVDYAGTDANVWITLHGKNGTNSGERVIDNAENNFEKGKTDTFSVESRDLGELEGVRIRHNNSGEDPGWFLDRVTVFDDREGKEWAFPCNRWLARDEDDQRIDRYLSVAS